jgi:galactose mutarotase-like enzyme
MVTIENELLVVKINPHGAELTSVYHKLTGLEYMWNADPEVWAKHSPVLFPIVGTLKDNTYQYQGKKYTLSRHGFAREKQFAVETSATDEAVFTLVHDAQTLAVFPFQFRFRLKYSLFRDGLSVTYEVLNLSEGDMYFSVGGHPAFRLPLVAGTEYSDYFLKFEQKENQGRWPISPEGLIEKATMPLLENTDTLPVRKELFSKDALVFKSLASSNVVLASEKTTHGIQFDFTGFPYLGLWAAKGADFICIEPWCGIADSVDTNQELAKKEGINKLVHKDRFTRTWSARFF